MGDGEEFQSRSQLQQPSQFWMVNQGAQTACSVFFFEFWIEAMDTCFILSYDPVDKIRFTLVARQNIS
jgi:hypothetical protein